MHFCHVELMAILSAIPMIGVGIAWLRRFFRNKNIEAPACHCESCEQNDYNKATEDWEKVASDWQAVGDDMRQAMGMPRKYD